MRHKFRCLGDGRQAILGERRRAVRPFGGLAVLVGFWRELGLLEAVRERLPFSLSLAQRDGRGRDPSLVLAFGERGGAAFLAR